MTRPRTLGHGTRACYKRGCRLPQCVDAEREYNAQRWGRTYDPDAVSVEPVAGASEPAVPRTVVDQGACLGSGVNFFPDPADVEGNERAKAVCASCPVIDECRAYILSVSARNDFGVWGGLSEVERKRVRRGRSSAVKPKVQALPMSEIVRRATERARQRSEAS